MGREPQGYSMVAWKLEKKSPVAWVRTELPGQLSLWVQWAPTPTCLTQASRDHVQEAWAKR